VHKHTFALCLLLASVSVDTIPAHAGQRSAVPSETVTLPNLRQPVEILIDRWGVPHIYARNEADLFFAQGFNAARDRLFQIDLWRRRGLLRAHPIDDRGNYLYEIPPEDLPGKYAHKREYQAETVSSSKQTSRGAV